MELITVDVPSCSALVALQGAQLLSWTPKNRADSIIWCAEEHFWTPGKPVRGGVPAAIFNPVVQMTAFKQPVYCAQFPAICPG